MKKITAGTIIVIVLSISQMAFAEGVAESLATAAGKGVAQAMGQMNGVVNITTTGKDSLIKGDDVEVGVVRSKKANANAIINVTTIGGEVDGRKSAKVGVVEIE